MQLRVLRPIPFYKITMNQSLEDRRRELYVGVCIAVHSHPIVSQHDRKQIPLDALAEFDKVFHNSEQKEFEETI